MTLADLLPTEPEPDAIYDAFAGWVERPGIELYPAPGGGADRDRQRRQRDPVHARPGRARAWSPPGPTSPRWPADGVTFYTAPIKALVSEKFFALCDIFGAEDVGHAHRRRERQRRRADHLLHGRGAGQHRAARGPARRRRRRW